MRAEGGVRGEEASNSGAGGTHAAESWALRFHSADRLLHLLSRPLRRALGVVRVMDVPVDAFERRRSLHAVPSTDRIIHCVKLHKADEFAVPVFTSTRDLKANEPTKVALQRRVSEVDRQLRKEEAIARRRPTHRPAVHAVGLASKVRGEIGGTI